MNTIPTTSTIPNRPYQQCAITVMDTIADPNITFDENGISNYYYEYLELAHKNVFAGKKGKERIDNIVQEIKNNGQGKKYNCITGVSGGVDSTYLVLQAKKLGLNPLVVHFDNGWNSETAVKNIHNIISRLGFDLYTLVVNWEEFKDLQLSYFKAGVVDIEALTDHAIIATLHKLARKYDIKYILSGNNVVTEGILPHYWIFNKPDSINIKAIHKVYGKVKLKTYPFYSTYAKYFFSKLRGVETICLLDYMDYNKKEVKRTIAEELDWKDYGGKHFESVFTRFYQGYILPEKFKIDKRKAHLSTLICSNQVSKEEALIELQTPIYATDLLNSDKKFVLKKLGLTEEEFEIYMCSPRREHIEFQHSEGVWKDVPMMQLLKPMWKLYKNANEYKRQVKRLLNLYLHKFGKRPAVNV
ncbi:MAG: N-acetyl sugar amidotransferase [Agriterribacter sp.]